MQFSIEDWWTGDLQSFLTGRESKYNIEVIEDCELLQIDNISLEQLYIKVPKFERFFRILMQNAYVALQQRVSISMGEKAEDRYLNFREKYPQLEQRLPQHQVASYLGITPEFLSRVRRQLINRK